MAALFRPCIDLRNGKVTQIVGGSLTEKSFESSAATVNFETDLPASEFAKLYQKKNISGGHVIMLGSGNEEAALSALSAFPGGLQVGGGITPSNALRFLEAGASHVIVTSYVFRDGLVDFARLAELVHVVGVSRLVLDLSCRKRPRRSPEAASEAASEAAFEYVVVTDRWQRFTDVIVSADTLVTLSAYCAEFLVHGVDVEGLQQGVDADLVALLSAHSPIPVTYAGGVRSLGDVRLVCAAGSGRVGVSVGSALALFGGSLDLDDVIAAATF